MSGCSIRRQRSEMPDYAIIIHQENVIPGQMNNLLYMPSRKITFITTLHLCYNTSVLLVLQELVVCLNTVASEPPWSGYMKLQ